jgi:hypothetical protein
LRPGWSAAAVAGPLAGVEAASEALSTLSTEGGRAAGSGDDEAGEVSFPFPLALGEPDFFPGLSENPLSSLGDSLRTNTDLEAPGRLERRLAELAEDAGMVVDRRAEVVWINIQSWCCVGRGEESADGESESDGTNRDVAMSKGVKAAHELEGRQGRSDIVWGRKRRRKRVEEEGREDRRGKGKGKGKAGDGKEGRRDKRMGHSEPYFVVFISSRRRRDEGWTVRRYGCVRLYVWYGTVLLLTNYTVTGRNAPRSNQPRNSFN